MSSDPKKKCCTPYVTVCALLIIGVILIITGGILIPVFKNLIDDNLRDGVKLKNGSDSYDEWYHTTSPPVMNYYLFDVQNPTEILAGKRPEVKERGPYVYREVRYKNLLQFAENGNEITYLNNISYYFDPSLSCANCSEKDVLMTADVAVMGIANTAHRTNVSTDNLKLLNAFVFEAKKASLFHPLTVRQIIWGYNDSTLIWLNKIKTQFPDLPIPSVSPWVALQYNVSAAIELLGNESVSTGMDKADKVQQYTKWRGAKNMSYWKGKYANMINGTDGTHFKPLISKSDVLYAFIPLICRSLYLVYEKETSVKDISLYRFALNDMIFSNYTKNPDNKGFCVPKCYPDGLLPIGQCLPNNPPILVSQPHFYQGDPSLSQRIKGLNPQKDKHQTVLDVEYLTGLTMQVHKGLQINVEMYKVNEIRILENITDMAFPILYLNEAGTINEHDANKFKRVVYKPILITEVVQYLLLGIGVLLVLIAIIIFVCTRKEQHRTATGSNSERERLLPDGHDRSPVNYKGTR